MRRAADPGTVHSGELDLLPQTPKVSNGRGSVENPGRIDAEVGVFFTEVLAGCSCGDEPYAERGYCEVQVDIDKRTGRARLTPLDG